jgi:hypothetical protein
MAFCISDGERPMGDDIPSGRLAIDSRRMAIQITLSWMVTFLLLGIIAAHVHHWNTGLFIWGFAVGVIGLLYQRWSIHFFAQRAGMSSEQEVQWRTKRRYRQYIYGGSYVVTGIIVGALAAMTGRVWLDVALTVYLIVVFVIGYFVARRVGRARSVSGAD